MVIKEMTEIKIWNHFFDANGAPSFLPSWEWGSFQQSLGYSILRLGLYQKNILTSLCLVIKINARRGRFLFIPHGPIIVKRETYNVKLLKNIISLLIRYLITLAKKEKYDFIRIAPILENTPKNQKIFQALGFKTAPIYMHAETVWVLPLTHQQQLRPLTDEELLSKMRKTTRYLIRKAQRDKVSIEKRTDQKAVDDFYKIYQETAKREKFVPFSKDYIKKEFEEFNKTGNALFLFAKLIKAQRFFPPAAGPKHWREGIFRQCPPYLASALIIFTPSTAFYHQGASIHTKIPVSYLLQWEAIKEARKRNCQFYNFWGIYDNQTKRMPKAWTGLTLFKTGFGGQKISYLPTQDYIISLKYWLTYFWEKFLFWRRIL